MKEFKKILKAFKEMIKMFSKAIGVAILITIPFMLVTWGLCLLFKNQWVVLGIWGLVGIVGWTWEFYKLEKRQ